jgi:hypothetical protein
MGTLAIPLPHKTFWKSSTMRLSLLFATLLVPVAAFVAPIRYTACSFSGRVSPRYYTDVALEERRQELKRKLPPVNRHQMSSLQIEFRELLEGILYTPQEIDAMTDTRLRAVYEGIEASYNERAVYRAFEVLYEDYMPLRIAGRMVYRKMNTVMEESKEYRQQQVQAVLAATNLSRAQVQSSWSVFVQLAEDREISTRKVRRHVAKRVVDILNYDNVADVLYRLDTQQKGRLSFQELMVGLYRCAVESNSDPANALQQILTFDISDVKTVSNMDEARMKYNQRYDEMLENFARWKEYIPSGEGRRIDILRGCFVGSENPKVVEALRVVYVDFPALRLCGDWIFKVVSSIMGRRSKN